MHGAKRSDSVKRFVMNYKSVKKGGKHIMQGDNSEIIRSFTKDDYLSPDGAPFKWLFDQRSDPFAYQRLRNMMADAAKD